MIVVDVFKDVFYTPSVFRFVFHAISPTQPKVIANFCGITQTYGVLKATRAEGITQVTRAKQKCYE